MQLALWSLETPPARPPAELIHGSAALALPPVPLLDELEAQANTYVHAAHADNTRRAYQTDWRAFEQWCLGAHLESLPATSHTLELYLTHLARLGRKASTIRRARTAIGLAHGHAGVPRPDQAARIRALERGIGRTHGAREEGALPLLDTLLERAVRTLGDSPREDRDRALLLLGFAGAFRSSELAGLNIHAVASTAAGLRVTVDRSKEDQLARGAVTEIPFGKDELTCPVRALGRWLGRVGRPSGPLFRVIRGASIEHERIHPKAVTRAVQRALKHAGIEGDYSSHSLRSGLATSAYAAGATLREIQLQGRWKDPRSVQRYIKLEHVPGRRNVAEGLL